MPSLFLSYRRGDSADTVKLIYERLKRRLPRWDIFYDHESIPLGDAYKAFDEQGVLRQLSKAEWLQAWNDLQARGGDWRPNANQR